MADQQVRVRFAPSPTGHMHVGGARSCLYNYLFAKRFGGQFVLRIEDTDLERSTEESMHMVVSDLNWLGLNWDEGPNPETLVDEGDCGPYRQSQRKDIYQKHADQLLAEGKAYHCFLSDEELDVQREAARAAGKPLQVNSPYRNMSLSEAKEKIAAGEQAVVRFKTPENKRDYVLQDLVRGEVTFPSDMVGDFVVMRSNGMPVYNFCCAVDDALMKITHVFRAEEHLNNTLRQMMIYEAFDYSEPQFGHMSIILGEDRQKLSKRHGATSVNQYREEGFLPEAMNNFLALLGWSSPKGQEILSMQELCEQFDADRLNPSSAVFDETKLRWVSATHLRALPHQELWQLVKPFLDQAGLELPEDPEWQSKALEVYKVKMETLKDAVELFQPLALGDLEISEKGMETIKWESTSVVIDKWKQLVESTDGEFLTEQQFLSYQDEIKTACNVKGKHLFMPIRVAVIGQPHGAELAQLVPLLKKQTLIQRADRALSFTQ